MCLTLSCSPMIAVDTALRFIDLVRKFAALLAGGCALAIFSVAPAMADTIVIYGASGNIGSKIVTEALNRDHEVIGVSRNPASLEFDHPNFTAVVGDVTSVDSMLGIITGVDAVIMSVRGNGADNSAEQTVTNRASLTFIDAAQQLGEAAPRVLQVGNQATLTRNGVLGLNSGRYKEGTALYGRVWAHALALENYQATTDVKWTIFSPSGSIAPGERTGSYRLGDDEVLLNEAGQEAGISDEDFAVAFIDEIENPQLLRQRKAVGY